MKLLGVSLAVVVSVFTGCVQDFLSLSLKMIIWVYPPVGCFQSVPLYNVCRTACLSLKIIISVYRILLAAYSGYLCTLCTRLSTFL